MSGGSTEQLGLILEEARQLQIQRLQNIFTQGFRFPENVCKKYLMRYNTEYRGHGGSFDVYQRLFSEFWDEVCVVTVIPAELTRLDRITLFGEICLGERLADGTLTGLRPDTFS